MSVQQDAQYGYDIIVVRSIEDLEVGTIFFGKRIIHSNTTASTRLNCQVAGDVVSALPDAL